MESALATGVAELGTIATSLGGYVVTAFIAAIGLGAIGFGLKYVWRMFKGAAR